MECPRDIQILLASLANHARKCRDLNRILNEEFDKLGIDTSTTEFENAFAYVEGDCDTTAILAYIEEL